MSSTSDEVGHTATPWEVSKIKLGGDAQIVRAGEDRTDVQPPSFVYCEREEDAAFIVRAVNSHDSLVKALEKTTDWIVALAASGDAGFWDGEKVEEVIEARAALSQAKGGK